MTETPKPRTAPSRKADGDPANLSTKRPLDLGTDDEFHLKPKDVGLHSDTPITPKRPAAECGMRIKPPKDRER